MKSLFAYIFVKSYYIYIDVLKLKDFPWAWGTAVVVIFLTLNIWSILGILEFFLFPNLFDWISYYKYFAVSFLLISWLIVYYKKADVTILQYYDAFSERKKKILRVLSLVYYVASVVIQNYVSELL
jgi:hypothetical protein